MINKICNKGITNAEYSIEYLFTFFITFKSSLKDCRVDKLVFLEII